MKYYCKNHNILCCSECIVKIKEKGFGKHINCNVCYIEDILEEKKKGINKNSKLLEELSSKFNKTFKDIKEKYEKINENKEQLKLKIQKIFTNIRNILNNREDELLLNVDKEYDNLYFKGDIIKDIEKLPNKIKISLDKYKNFIENKLKDENIIKEIKECLEIENNINIINKTNSFIEMIEDSKNNEIIFTPEEKELDKFIEPIKNFGLIKTFNSEIGLKLSLIINNDINNTKLILDWIKETINKDEIKFELIFRMSENGTNSEDFHKYCDNKGPTLTLVKTTKNDLHL